MEYSKVDYVEDGFQCAVISENSVDEFILACKNAGVRCKTHYYDDGKYVFGTANNWQFDPYSMLPKAYRTEDFGFNLPFGPHIAVRRSNERVSFVATGRGFSTVSGGASWMLSVDPSRFDSILDRVLRARSYKDLDAIV